MDSHFNDEQTLTLLKLVHRKDIQDKFVWSKKKHRKVWEEISNILELQGIKKSPAKCQNRYENTKRLYGTIKRKHIGPEKPNVAYWDFYESILGEKKDVPFEGFEEFHEYYLKLKETRRDGDPIPDWEHWHKYEEYYEQRELMTETDHIPAGNVQGTEMSKHFDYDTELSYILPDKCPTPIFSDRDTDELLLIMGEAATRQMFINSRKNHKAAWDYILKRLKKKGIHKTVVKVRNRFENLKRKYIKYKRNLNSRTGPPDWRYWNVFEEYMASRPNPSESDFMADDEHLTTEPDEEMETDINESDFEEGRSKFEIFSLQEYLRDKTIEKVTDNPIDVDSRHDEKFCRICLQSDSEKLVSLFGQLNANIRINEALAICVGLEIQQDSSTGNHICVDCIKQLEATYKFRELCLASQYESKSNRNHFHVQDGTDENEANSPVVQPEPEPDPHTKYDLIPETITTEIVNMDFSGSPSLEIIYEFVDTNPIPNDKFCQQYISEKDAETKLNGNETTNPSTKYAGYRVENLKNFKCSICLKKFPNIEYIKKHLETIHSLISDSQNFKNYLELSNCDSDDELDDNVKCYICGKSYIKREYVKKHLKLVHNITDADYNVFERIDEENKTKRPLLCHSCGESFVLKYSFKKHIEHHERTLLSCDHCDIRLVDQAALDRHMILHTGQRNYKCIYCEKGFFTRMAQKRHERNGHTKEKTHICQYCNKGFVMWKFLERHINTHTGEVTYDCDQCDKKYLNKNHLRVHKFRHGPEAPFKCPHCPKEYYDRSALKKHNYVHIGNPYHCTNCERTFDRRDKMHLHMQRVHDVARPNNNQETVVDSMTAN